MARKKETRGRKKILNKMEQLSVGLYKEEITQIKNLARVERKTASSLGREAIAIHLLKYGYIYNKESKNG